MIKRHLPTFLSALLLSIALLCFGNTLWVKGKAVVAQMLIKQAWENTLSQGKITPPWSWADTWPVAALTFPNHHKTLYALAGSHGTSLAFGPGHIDGTALPGEAGTMVFSGHRDTHFRFLKDIKIGEVFRIQQQDGRWQRYRVTNADIVDTRSHTWYIERDKEEVQLVTCYPFDDPTPNPRLRFIVKATPL